jgi:hypothetical protein
VPEHVTQLIEERNVIEEKISIEKHHKIVSEIATPPEYIEKKNKIDYVELSYMRYIANSYYPGWSWYIIGYDLIREGDKLVFVSVHGRLKWVEPDGTKRTGDMIAAHRIQYTGEGKETLMDPGNDIKSANTDTMKKAMNLYLNIADDVYRFKGPELSDGDKAQLEAYIDKIGSEKVRKLYSKKYGVNNKNLLEVIQRLKYEEQRR